MLVKLLPENITKNWDVIKYAIEQSLPPMAGEGPDKMNRILEALLAGTAECWIQYFYKGKDENDAGLEIKSVAVSYITTDFVSDTKSLLGYAMYNFHPMSDKDWAENYLTLREYARSKGCTRITGFSDNPRIIELAQKLGGETKYTFFTLPC